MSLGLTTRRRGRLPLLLEKFLNRNFFCFFFQRFILRFQARSLLYPVRCQAGVSPEECDEGTFVLIGGFPRRQWNHDGLAFVLTFAASYLCYIFLFYL